VRRPLSWLLRAVRDDSGLTAVEYALLAGMIIAVGGAAAFSLGQGVNKSSGRVTWANGSAGSHHGSRGPAVGSILVATPPSSAAQKSVLPWALLSLGVSIAGVAGFVGWHHLRDTIRQGRTRRKVRQSLTGPEGQAALERMVRKLSREPVARIKQPDTRLIGRNGPDPHHWIKGQNVSLSGDLQAASGRFVGPETDIEFMTRLRLAGPMQALPPTVPVAG
jgi:Flp pilus assembly pilin Flp